MGFYNWPCSGLMLNDNFFDFFLKNIVNQFIDYFIHPINKASNSDYEKNRIAVVAFLMVFLVVTTYSLFYCINGSCFDFKASQNYIGLLVATIALMINKRKGNTNLALSFSSLFGLYLIIISVYLSGGIYSRDIIWYMVIVAASFMFIGVKMGVLITGLSFISISSFFLFEKIQMFKADVSPVLISVEYHYVNFTLVLLLLAFMLFVLVKSNIKLQTIIKHNQTQEIREVIARDFHDQIGNKLVSVKHLVGVLKYANADEDKTEILDKIERQTKDIYENFKDFIWTKDPKSDLLQEIFMYLRDFADDLFKHSDVNLFISASPEKFDDIILPPNWSREIVPMFKEIINNAFKHAHAANVYINFELKKNVLNIIVSDDGVGCLDYKSSKGKGLKNIGYRAGLIGAEVKIEPRLPNGTKVHFVAKIQSINQLNSY